MTSALKTRIIRIGNSHGIRIPKVMLQQVGLADEVEVEAQAGQLVIRPLRVVRQGWADQFAEMRATGDDQLVEEETLTLTAWEASEWQW